MVVNIARALAVALTSTLLAAGLGSPASAGTQDVDVSASKGVRYEGCHGHKYQYSIDASDYHSWDAVAIFRGPGRGLVDKDYLADGDDKPSGTSSGFICDDDPVGEYSIELRVTFYDEYDEEVDDTWSYDNFRLRKPRTRTSYTVTDTTPRYGQFLTFRVVSKLEGRRGYHRNDYSYIALEARRANGWQRIPGSKDLTNNRGVSRLKARWQRRQSLAIRAITVRTPIFEPSASDPRRLG